MKYKILSVFTKLFIIIKMIQPLNGTTFTWVDQESSIPSSIILENSSLSVIENMTVGPLESDSSSNITLSAQLTIDTNPEDKKTFSGTISGKGSLVKVGGGSQKFTGHNTFTGGTTVLCGQLIIDNVNEGDFFVLGGGCLSGKGTLGNNVFIKAAGTISPGNGMENLLITGDYRQSTGGMHLVHVNSLGQNSLLSVAGRAYLDGFVGVASPQESYAFHHPYKILEAAGGFEGTHYLKAIATNPFIIPLISYNANQAFLTLETNFRSVALTSNQKSTATQLDHLTKVSPEQASMLNILVHLSMQEAQRTLTRVAGEQYTHLNLASDYANQRFSRRIYSAVREQMNSCPSKCQLTQTWLRLEDGRSSYKSNQWVKGFKSKNYDGSLGSHIYLNKNLLLGAAASYEKDFLRFSQGGDLSWNTFQGAVYAAYRVAYFYAFSNAILGESWGSFRRPIYLGSLPMEAHSKPKILHSNWYTEMGAFYPLKNFLIQPFAGIGIGAYHSRNFKESGAYTLNLEIQRQTVTSLSSYLGTHLSATFYRCFNASIDLIWQHRFDFSLSKLKAKFEKFGSVFFVRGTPPGANSFLSSINFWVPLMTNLEIYSDFTGEWWKRWSVYSCTMGFSAYW